MVSADELNTLREQGVISERPSTKNPEQTYTVVDSNYGLKPGAERPVFDAKGKRVRDGKKKSDDDFSLLPASLRARLLKEQQPDTSTDYSLLPNGWSQGDLQ